MASSVRIPHVSAMDISARGRIAAGSGWHRAQTLVDALPDAPAPGASGATPWSTLIDRLGGTTALANRSLAELQPILAVANRIIDVLNSLPEGARFVDIERGLGLREPPSAHDRIGDAMSRVFQALERRRAENASADRR